MTESLQNISAASTTSASPASLGTNALDAGIVSCSHCHQLVKWASHQSYTLKKTPNIHFKCPKCNNRLSPRRYQSLQRTWALTITAIICLIPANTLPIMSVVFLGQGHPDTIFSGVITLIQSGAIPIALVVFFASILVPVLKIVALIILLSCVHWPGLLPPQKAMTLYRIVEGVGRWSMLDIFVITILATTVDFGLVAQVSAALGALAFAATVVLTLLAAQQFDPRLIWDAFESHQQFQTETSPLGTSDTENDKLGNKSRQRIHSPL